MSIYINFGFTQKRRRYFLVMFSFIIVYVEVILVLSLIEVFSAGKPLDIFLVSYTVAQQAVSIEINVNVSILTAVRWKVKLYFPETFFR